MTAREYFDEVHKVEAELEAKYSKQGYVYVTSVRNLEKGSTAGATVSATFRIAALNMVKGTHREAVQSEIDVFLERQNEELRKSTLADQRKGNTTYVVLDKTPETALAGNIRQAKAKD